MISTRVSNARLLKLAEFLEELPTARFDYGTWGNLPLYQRWKAKKSLKTKTCGTSACAIGWAAVIPAFNALGLKPNPISGYPIFEKDGISENDPIRAGCLLFGIDYMESSLLFIPGRVDKGLVSPGDGAGPKSVARHIRRFVAQKEKQAQQTATMMETANANNGSNNG